MLQQICCLGGYIPICCPSSEAEHLTGLKPPLLIQISQVIWKTHARARPNLLFARVHPRFLRVKWGRSIGESPFCRLRRFALSAVEKTPCAGIDPSPAILSIHKSGRRRIQQFGHLAAARHEYPVSDNVCPELPDTYLCEAPPHTSTKVWYNIRRAAIRPSQPPSHSLAACRPRRAPQTQKDVSFV